MRKPVIAGNWKMYKLLSESAETALSLKNLAANINHCEIVIAPVFTALKTVADKLEGSNIHIAAQNCATEREFGAQTGEISARMIRDAGCTHVIIGHSERRQFYAETDEAVNQKVQAALASKLTAIVCVGETLFEHEAGKANEVVERQINSGLRDLTTADMKSIIIAYEPVWAIGTGIVASPQQAQEMHGLIRRSIEKWHSYDVAAATRILYGGSVKPSNIKGLMEQADIDGALVGGASLDAASFAQIIDYL
jgi:triosephosphate isomerase